MEARPVMNLSAALERFDGDRELFLTLAAMFIERATQTITAIQAALSSQDLALLAKEAHKLKGSAMEFCADAAVATADQLETRARAGAVQEMVELGERMQVETRRLADELLAITERGFPS